jgi:O-antigen ligase
LLQVAALFVIGFICVISRPRLLLLRVFEHPAVPIEFQVVSLSLPDLFVLLLLIISLLRVVLDTRFRARLRVASIPILTRLGGAWWLALALWMTLSLVWADDPIILRFVTLHLVALIGMAFLLALATQEYDLRWLLAALLAGAVVQATVALLQIANNGPLGLSNLGEIERFSYDPISYYRAPGLSMHPNYLGGYFMVAGFACALLACQNLRQGVRPLIPAAVAILALAGIVATLSRSAILSTTIGCLPLIVWLFRSLEPRWRRRLIGLLLVAMVVALVWVFLVLHGTYENLAYRFFLPREFFLANSWQVIQQQPILGAGAGNLMLRIARNVGPVMTDLPLLPVHNVYLYIWAELGLIGLALFGIACFQTLRAFLKGHFIWGCCWIAILVVMLFDNYFWAIHPFRVLLFWVIGLGWGLALQAQQEPS